MAHDPVEDFNVVGVKELLDADARPTFVIDLDPDSDSRHIASDANAILPLFCNAALRTHELLFEGIIGVDAKGVSDPDGSRSYEEFRAWIRSITTHDDSRDIYPLAFTYGQLLWTGSTVQKRWRIISGNRQWLADAAVASLSYEAPVDITEIAPLIKQPEESPKVDDGAQKDVNAQTTGNCFTGMASTRTPETISHSESRRQPTAGEASDDTAESFVDASMTLAAGDHIVTDWTSAEPRGILSPHLQFARSIDWAATPLGPMTEWSPEFRQIANLCMGDPRPVALFWGRELTTMYNEAYAVEVAGNKHPSIMGTGFSGPFGEIWHYTRPIFADCASTGRSARYENDPLAMYRHGFLEETFYSWSFTPCYGGTDTLQGFWNAPFETTQQVLMMRRLQTINRLGECTALARTIKRFWSLVLEGLEDNPNDIPFALLYSVGESEADSDQSSVSSGGSMSIKTCHLEGTLGVPEGHPAAPAQMDLKRSPFGFIPSFREAMRTRVPLQLHARDGSLPTALLEGIEWRGFGDPCREATIFPVRPTNTETVLAFLVLGQNPRRNYDKEYQAFTSLLNRQLSTSLASVMLYEEEVSRSKDMAERAMIEQGRLTEQLELQHNRYRRMTESSPNGMFLVSPEGNLREANDRFFEMTGQTRESQPELCWTNFLGLDRSSEALQQGWDILVQDHRPWSCELQMRPQARGGPTNLEGESIDYWVLCTALSELANDGSLLSIMGSITDISHLKWVLGLQERQLAKVEESRRQQNEFIDMTSHEVRNPMTAIMQLAEEILNVLREHTRNGEPVGQQKIPFLLEAAQTILLCVTHQKSIVDDILLISKLDSNLVVISPIPARPESTLKHVVKMVEPQLLANKIDCVFIKDSSYEALNVDWVMFDAGRVAQIILNLLGNAIKFTAPAETRKITACVGASTTMPDASGMDLPDFEYADSKTTDITSHAVWGGGEPLYIFFRVMDTGCGLTPGEKQILFQRFQQASPRTHGQYGGSGMGLFISRKMAELHGGKIGVAARAGEGCLFAFFVQARRCPPPSPNSAAPQSPKVKHHRSEDYHFEDQDSEDHRSGDAEALKGKELARESDNPPQPPPIINTALDSKRRDIHMLVVEDNIVNRTVLMRQLDKLGYHAESVEDGVQALAFIEESHYCKPGGEALTVVFMDLEMPRMDGLTCIRKIRAMQREGKIQGHVPVIAMTANVRNEQIDEAKQSGMDEVMAKPFKIQDVIKIAERTLAGVPHPVATNTNSSNAGCSVAGPSGTAAQAETTTKAGSLPVAQGPEIASVPYTASEAGPSGVVRDLQVTPEPQSLGRRRGSAETSGSGRRR